MSSIPPGQYRLNGGPLNGTIMEFSNPAPVMKITTPLPKYTNAPPSKPFPMGYTTYYQYYAVKKIDPATGFEWYEYWDKLLGN